MPNLTLKRSGIDRIFLPDGNVAVLDAGGNTTSKGTWKSHSDRSSNRLAYTFDGANDEVEIQYEFNDRNQLVAFFPAAANEGTESAKITYQGRIFIDDNQDVAYELFDEFGAATERRFVVHGELALSDALDKLTVTLPGGTSTIAISGEEPGKNNLDPGVNQFDTVNRDSVRFKAVTSNDFGGVQRDDDAIVLFLGTWDLNKNGLAFEAKGKNGAITLQLTARVGVVTAGLAYFHDAAGQSIAFIIQGKHRFKSGTGEANWQLFLGHSDKQFEAKFTAGLKVDNLNRKLTINGNLSLLGGPEGTSIKASLDARFEIKEGELIFKADVESTGTGVNYNLLLAGKYKVNAGTVTFEMKLAGNPNDLTLSLNASFSRPALQVHISFLLKKTTSGDLSINLNFEISARWIAGVIFQPDDPILKVSNTPAQPSIV
jgi:hypothetical protein